MRLLLLACIAFTNLLSGCATSPPSAPSVELKRGDRVGILVESSDNLTHTHVGTTVFNNFSTRYPYDMALKSKVYQTVENAVRAAGLQAVNLSDAGVRSVDLSGLIELSGNEWKTGPGKEDALIRLKNDLNLRAVLTIRTARALAMVECSGGPCNFRYVNEPGLFTRSVFGPTRYFAVAAYQWNLYSLDPVADLARVKPLVDTVYLPSTPLRGFKDPADFKKLTADELVPVLEGILESVQTAATVAVQSLNVR